MKEKPLCTIILPTIGRPKYLGAALASVAAQTYRPINILVSDNAAVPPIELSELRKWAPEAKLRLIHHSTRLGIPQHINLCLNEADGEYVFLMSDDDLIVPGYINAAMECMLREPSVGMVVARQMGIDESFFGPISNTAPTFQVSLGNKFATKWFNRENPGIATMFPLLAKRQQILQFGGFPDYPTGSYCDITVFLQLCLGAKFGFLESGYYYRIYGTSAGLGAPWRGLLTATNCYERDLFKLYRSGRLEKELFLSIIRGNSGLLLSRWKELYRHRPGFENKVRPLVDLVIRTLAIGYRHGFGSLPKLHRYFNGE